MTGPALPLAALAVGAVLVGVGLLLVRLSGADTRTGRRLAGAPTIPLTELHRLAAADDLPRGPVRIHGRVRCSNPIHAPDGDRLAALHRDVEVRLPGGQWRTIERVRDARRIDLWERATAVPIDLAAVAEPLVTIPQVWHGNPAELGAPYRAALDRLAASEGAPDRARSTTRQVTLVDQLIVLAHPARDVNGRLNVEPPPGGYVVSAVELDTAMRLLAGPRRPQMLAGFGIGLLGAGVVAIGCIALIVTLVA